MRQSSGNDRGYIPQTKNMKKTTCSLCLAGSQQKEHGTILFHVVENMTEDGRAQIAVCADSSVKPAGKAVALKIE
jgi:hypothetical protein